MVRESGPFGAVDWSMVNEHYWRDTTEDMDRQRRKQAEFLVHGVCPWSLIHRLVVIDDKTKTRVEEELAGFPDSDRKTVDVCREWYYS